MTPATAHALVATALLGVAGCSLGGCQAEYRSDAKRVAGLYSSGQFELASDDASAAAISNRNDQQNRLVYRLEAARTAQAAERWAESGAWFLAADELVRPYLDTEAEAKVTEAFATTLVNQTTSMYRATPNERIMLSTLQSISSMAEGKWDDARVQLRQAQEWQEDAKTRYRKAIEEARRASDSAQSKEGIDATSMIGGADFAAEAALAPGLLDGLKGYGDYANPFAYWLRGTFLCHGPDMTWQDRANGRNDLAIAAAMLEGDARESVERQLAELDASSASGTLPATWFVVHSAGMAPRRSEWKITLPLPINDTFVLVTAAYPYIESTGQPVAPILAGPVSVESASARPALTYADFDRIVSSEFDEVKGIIYAQETLSASIKSVASYAMQQSASNDASGFIALAAALYQISTNAADLRSWRTLPRTLNVLAVPTPTDGRIQLRRGDGTILRELAVPPASSGLLLVTMPAVGVPSSVSTIPFDASPAAKAPLLDPATET